MACWSPVSTASARQWSMWSFRMIFAVLLSAERTAASWMSTSAQSRPSSTMRLTDSRWPIARASRLTTALVCVWVCGCAWVCPSLPWQWVMTLPFSSTCVCIMVLGSCSAMVSSPVISPQFYRVLRPLSMQTRLRAVSNRRPAAPHAAFQWPFSRCVRRRSG